MTIILVAYGKLNGASLWPAAAQAHPGTAIGALVLFVLATRVSFDAFLGVDRKLVVTLLAGPRLMPGASNARRNKLRFPGSGSSRIFAASMTVLTVLSSVCTVTGFPSTSTRCETSPS